jgi:hypothetical protein
MLAHAAGQVQGSREVGVLHIRRTDSRRGADRTVPDVIAGTGPAGTGPASCQPKDANS